MFHDGVSGGCVTQTEYLIAKFASEAKLNKRTGDKLIALTSRADFNLGEIRTNSIRQIERWIADANDPNAIQEFDLLRASDGKQELTLYLRNLIMIVEDLVADPRYNGFQYLSFELLERNGQRVFGPANSGVWWQINARDVGTNIVLVALVVFEDESFAMQCCEPL